MQRIDGCLITTAVNTDIIVSQIKENNKLGLTNVCDMEEFREQVPIAIVGGGPSLKNTIEELKNYKIVMACGSVHDFLVQSNVAAKWCVLCDPDPLVVNYLKHVNYETQYLVASQCHPEVFKHLWRKQNNIEPLHWDNVKIWHAGGENFDPSNFGPNQRVIGGGCTVGTRALVMALNFGYRNIHLFGFDSCLDSNYKHHSYEFDNPEVETIGNITEIRIDGPESPIFRVAGYMMGQIFDFKNLLTMYGDIMNVTVHGEGALKYLMDLGKKKYQEKNNGQ